MLTQPQLWRAVIGRIGSQSALSGQDVDYPVLYRRRTEPSTRWCRWPSRRTVRRPRGRRWHLEADDHNRGGKTSCCHGVGLFHLADLNWLLMILGIRVHTGLMNTRTAFLKKNSVSGFVEVKIGEKTKFLGFIDRNWSPVWTRFSTQRGTKR